jgi:hypothetical protein
MNDDAQTINTPTQLMIRREFMTASPQVRLTPDATLTENAGHYSDEKPDATATKKAPTIAG